MDHVVPRSQGGGDTWLNTVAACAADNHRKADRTPAQAGMALEVKPFEPTPADALLLALGLQDGEGLPDWLAVRGTRGGSGARGASGVRAAPGARALPATA